jgi:hypothetical protein
MTRPMRIEVVGESRTDHASRKIEIVENGPQYSYQRRGSWRNPEPKTITWQVTEVRIGWSQGVLTRVDVSGLRVKKDGTVGLVRETAYFRPLKGDRRRLTGYVGYESQPIEWDWLNTLVAEHSTPPPFGPADEV